MVWVKVGFLFGVKRPMHKNMVESILKYVKGTPGKGICMGRYVSIDIVGYWDADWAGYIVQ